MTRALLSALRRTGDIPLTLGELLALAGSPPPSRARASDACRQIVRWLVLQPSVPHRTKGSR
jgi:hypothetical protein